MDYTILASLREKLKAHADEHTRQSGLRFFKEEIIVYGVKAAVVQKISKDFYSLIQTEPKEKIFAYCEQLWKSGVMEEAIVACNWSHALRKKFVPDDMLLFERWINQYVSNWATCDTFCNHTMGAFFEKYPEQVTILKTFATSPNRWMKRAAAVSLIVPARKGLFGQEIFELATLLLLDTDDMVQKGYGWLLKVYSQKHETEVFTFVMNYKAYMPRTALRYAIEKMPESLRKQAMNK
jgi:3-methyladenine DNA glycosylase AlkD